MQRLIAIGFVFTTVVSCQGIGRGDGQTLSQLNADGSYSTPHATTATSVPCVRSYNKTDISTSVPAGPDLTMTPGSLCEKPTEYRYAEHIKYCERAVKPETKDAVLTRYDKKLGYGFAHMPRGEYKIDHMIPLCIGGSNEVDNLWPQHKSVYVYTDAIEPRLCALMEMGKMLQAEAVSMIREAKRDLSRTPAICADLDVRLGK